ncbi:MAG: hypothetical protein [Bacteriophage sp.]|nr:MAG: hypothetical protein [Bacteriophage sp.]
MSDRKVIKIENLPTKFPAVTTVVFLMAIDVWSIPSWGKGVIWTLLALIWLGAAINFYREKRIDIFEGK